MNTEHTPTPWHIRESENYKDKGWREIFTEDRRAVVSTGSFLRTQHGETESHCGVRISKENAEFIVTACNSYDAREALVKELVEALDALRNAEWMMSCDWAASERRNEVLEKADDVLAKAKGDA